MKFLLVAGVLVAFAYVSIAGSLDGVTDTRSLVPDADMNIGLPTVTGLPSIGQRQGILCYGGQGSVAWSPFRSMTVLRDVACNRACISNGHLKGGYCDKDACLCLCPLRIDQEVARETIFHTQPEFYKR